jgi:hypothetical protein
VVEHRPTKCEDRKKGRKGRGREGGEGRGGEKVYEGWNSALFTVYP